MFHLGEYVEKPRTNLFAFKRFLISKRHLVYNKQFNGTRSKLEIGIGLVKFISKIEWQVKKLQEAGIDYTFRVGTGWQRLYV